uniref:Uncharacterized protein n=1 Tax=Setaria italica TaxID=4555 RepID=K3YF23_SETIT
MMRMLVSETGVRPLTNLVMRSNIEFEWSTQMMDGQCQANLCYSARHSLFHFHVFKLASVIRIPYVFQ